MTANRPREIAGTLDGARSSGDSSFWALCACGAALIAFGALAWHAQWIDSFDLFVPAALAQGGIYALAAWLFLHRPSAKFDSHRLLMVIFGVAAMLRVIALATPPNFLSTDVYRYVWDGRVQAAGVNPYLYVPADPALASLEDEAIYSHINRADTAPTIYAPFAQMVFFAVTRLGESVTAMRLAMLGFETVAAVALALLLRRFGLPLERLALYLWHPLPIWEFVCGAHVDAVLAAMSMLALLAAVDGRRGWSGALLALATLTKFFPLVIAPALWRRWDWKAPAAFMAVVVLSYSLYISAGWKALGYLWGYAAEEGLARGDAVFLMALLRRVGLGATAAAIGYAMLAVAALGALALRAVMLNRKAEAMPVLAGGLAAVAMALISPHYPWYFAWLVPFIALAPRPSLIWLTTAAAALYATQWPLTLGQGLFIYGPFLALFLVEQRLFTLPRLREGMLS